jgi:hypothetical protein
MGVVVVMVMEVMELNCCMEWNCCMDVTEIHASRNEELVGWLIGCYCAAHEE